jgi:VanZ family protein
LIVRPRRFWVFLTLTLLWMGVIFWKSSEPYSQQDLKPWLSTLISEDALIGLLPPLEFTYDGGLVSYRQPYGFVEFFIRKGGHVTEYFILAALLWQTLTATSLHRPLAFALAFFLSILYAASDEWHQTFVPNRTGHSIDVVVDAFGVVLALFIIPSLSKICSSKRSTSITD